VEAVIIVAVATALVNVGNVNALTTGDLVHHMKMVIAQTEYVLLKGLGLISPTAAVIVISTWSVQGRVFVIEQQGSVIAFQAMKEKVASDPHVLIIVPDMEGVNT
jgi:hypothetical protein